MSGNGGTAGDFAAALHPASGIPFIALLLAIAILPLARPRFWHSDRNKTLVTGLLAAPILILLLARDPGELRHTAVEYFSFMSLLAALFTISGGIFLRGDLKATPTTNTAFLALGAVLANLVGTTGASMLLIRPFLRTNSERRNTRHLPIFFIFLVSNIGGCLTALGDPPLFLGYLRGVPFFWTFRLFVPWLTTLGMVLAVFLVFELNAYRRETRAALVLDELRLEPLAIDGKRNFILLAAVVGAIFLQAPLREAVMLGAAAVSYALTPAANHARNGFSFRPIAEVAILFAGIFVTMVPALLLIERQAPELGITEPWQFFWLTGGLSSFLDNAPTYLTFFTLAQGLESAGGVAGIPAEILAAVSLGAVFMGANTYIGNGPNFMVKAIADGSGLRMPSFAGYMAYSAVILLPIFALVSWAFFG